MKKSRQPHAAHLPRHQRTIPADAVRQTCWPLLASLVVLWLCAFCISTLKAADQASIAKSRDSSDALRNDAGRHSVQQALLGQKLFFDKRLSADGATSCATCHQPARAFADGLPVAIGAFGKKGTRNTPSLLNVKFSTSLFWDGRRQSLEEQALEPLINPVEHGLQDISALLSILRTDGSYQKYFAEAFDVQSEKISGAHAAAALAAFQRSLVATDSPFDRFQRLDEGKALPASAQRGLQLFQDQAQCASCHTIGASSASFSDEQFHSLSVGFKRIESKLADLTKRIVKERALASPLDHTILNDAEIAELGRFVVTLNPADIGKFRTPSLRNVALTYPYMHDGSVATLEEAVDLEVYYRSTQNGRPLVLTPAERSDLLEFLRALTSPEAARLAGVYKDKEQ